MSDQIAQRVQADALKGFCAQAFQKVRVAEEDARLTADILVAADLRGISSHGVAHLRRYVEGLRHGNVRSTSVGASGDGNARHGSD